jgi:hypothetical protein
MLWATRAARVHAMSSGWSGANWEPFGPFAFAVPNWLLKGGKRYEGNGIRSKRVLDACSENLCAVPGRRSETARQSQRAEVSIELPQHLRELHESERGRSTHSSHKRTFFHRPKPTDCRLAINYLVCPSRFVFVDQLCVVPKRVDRPAAVAILGIL